MSAVAASGRDVLVIGGLPSVDLLPPEVRAYRKSKAMHRWVIIALVGLIAVVALAVAAAFAGSVSAQLAYVTAQDRTAQLVAQQKQFAEVFAVRQAITAGQEAQRVAGSTEIDWQAVNANIQANLPAGSGIAQISVAQGTPMAPLAAQSAALQNPHIATATFTVASPAFISAADLIDGMTRVPGYVDAWVTSSAKAGEGEGFQTQVVLDLGAAALTGRFTPKEGQ